jgi:hypothetical protein
VPKKYKDWGTCKGDCGFELMSAAEWKRLPAEERPMDTHRRNGGQGYCSTCYAAALRSGKIEPDPVKQKAQAHRRVEPLTENQVRRLRKMNREWWLDAQRKLTAAPISLQLQSEE